MIRNRLFVIIISILTITLIFSGLIYFKNMEEVFNVQVEQDLSSDIKYLNNYIKQKKTGVDVLVKEIVSNEDIQSSLNMISLYEDPKEYVKEIFDFEKNNLIEYSKKWIKDTAHYSMEIFNKEFELVMINRNLDQHKALGYISYDENGKKLFLDYQTKKSVNIPVDEVLGKTYINKMQLQFLQERFLLSYIEPIYLDKNLIGYLKVTTCIDSEVLKDVNKFLNLTTILVDQNSNYLFPSQKLQKKFAKFQSSKNIETIESKLLELNNKLYAISLIDKTLIHQKQKEIIFAILELWVLILFIAFAFSFYFINRSVLKPLDNLKNIIIDIKNQKKIETVELNEKDEISNIVKEFNSLSVDLSKNMAFLASYEKAMDQSSIVSKADLKGNITYVNENFCKVTGFTKDEVIGKPHSIVRHESNTKEIFEELWETIKEKKVWKGILKNKGKLDDYWVDIVILPVLDENNEIVEYIAVRHDITKMIEQQEKLNTIANTDMMTGYGNRYKLNLDIKNAQNPSIALINIDGFSLLNDFYGHELGDKVIKEFGENIYKNMDTESCKLYHLQGDEYVILNFEATKDIFIEKIKRLVNILSKELVYINGETITLNLSVAISFENKETLLSSVDMALKVAKRDNLDFVVYNENISLNNEYENNIKWTKKIKEALEEDRFEAVFQPIVYNENAQWKKYESLVRLKEIDGKLVSPFFFLDISKKSKNYNHITKVMLNKSFQTFQHRTEEFSINLTIEDILNKEIVSHIFNLLKKYKLGDRVVFEIVESELIEDFDKVIGFISDVKQFGCKIAIDDFGTGYSNFEYLMKLQADYIKIDGSLIKDINKNENGQIVVSTIVDFAKKMGIQTIAEFVEDESILKTVKDLGIDYSQGYHFSKPLKKEEL